MLYPNPKAEQTLGQRFRRAAVLRCVRHSSTSVSAPVGLGGRQPGNYAALTTSQERKAHYHTHTQKHLFWKRRASRSHIPTCTHTHNIFLPILSPHTHTHIHRPSQTQGLHYVKEYYNDSDVTRLRSCSAFGVSVPEFTVWGKRLSSV